MIGIIQATKPSQTGKTLGVQIGGQWYSTKSPELAQMVGQSITFESSVQTFPDGGSCTWLNDYTIDNNPAQPTPSDQAMNQALGEAMHQTMQNQAPPMGQPAPPRTAQVNKDALIGALALTKSITGRQEQVWEAFVYFYHKMDNFDPSEPFG